MASFDDPDQVAAAKADGIGRAEDHADELWKEVAFQTLLEVAKRRVPFTADDVIVEIPEDITTHEPSALGPVFLRAARADYIVKTGRLIPTKLARRHRDLTEWISTRALLDQPTTT